jgi:hypothetical protein
MPHYYDQILNILREMLTANTAMHRQVFKSICVYAPCKNVCFRGIMCVRYGCISTSRGNEISVAHILGTIHSPMPKKPHTPETGWPGIENWSNSPTRPGSHFPPEHREIPSPKLCGLLATSINSGYFKVEKRTYINKEHNFPHFPMSNYTSYVWFQATAIM